MTDYAALRRNMVDTQLRTNDVTDARLIRAMLEVPREAFVPPQRRAAAYSDLCVELGRGRVLLDPRTFAKLAQAVEIGAHDNVLDVGCASGFSTAVLARVAAKVVGLEEDAALLASARAALRGAANITLAEGPLAAGWTAGAPYDVIFMNGAVEFVPPALFEQLNENGRLACVMRVNSAGQAMVFTRHDGAIGDRAVFDAGVPKLPGFERRKSFIF